MSDVVSCFVREEGTRWGELNSPQDPVASEVKTLTQDVAWGLVTRTATFTCSLSCFEPYRLENNMMNSSNMLHCDCLR